MPRPNSSRRSVALLVVLASAAAISVPLTARRAAAESGTDADTTRRAQVLAKFEGGTVTVGEMEDSILRQSPYMRKRYMQTAARKDLLDRLVRFELLALAAAQRGYAKNPDVVASVKETMVQNLMKEAVEDPAKAASVGAEDIARHYEEHRNEFVRVAKRRAAHVLVGTAEEAQSLLEKLRGADLRAFREIARKQSVDETSKTRGGDLGYFDAEGVIRGGDAPSIPAPIVKATFALETVGDVVPEPVAIEGGFSIVKLTGNRPANERSLASAEPKIRARLARDRRRDATDAFFSKLKAEHPPKVDAQLLQLVQ